MNKLGFAIKLASQGAGNAIECNKGQWTSKVVDIREYLKLFNGLQGTDNIVTFMSFDESGCFLTLLRAISGRMGDFLSGWIYIPNTIEATGDDIMNAYNYVCNILSQSNLSECKDDIDAFFSKEYPSKEFPAQYMPSKGQVFGIRYLGHYSLKEIVGEHRYQPYYSRYKAIFLLEKEGEVKVAKEAINNFENLTSLEIVKSAVLIPPTYTSLQKLGRGTNLLTQDGKIFSSPLFVNVGTTVSFILTRQNFENMRFDVPVTSERQNTDLSNAKVIWSKRISPALFGIVNSKGDIIKSAQIYVEGTDITNKDILLAENDCKQATVKVLAPDYETDEKKRNLLTEGIEIVLHRKIRSTQMKIELANGELADMTLEHKELAGNNDSPLTGYALDNVNGIGGDKILRINPWFVWKQRLWGFFAALIVFIFIIACTAFDSWLDTHRFKMGLPPWEESRPVQQSVPEISQVTDDASQDQTDNQGGFELQDTTDSTLDAAIKYLDGNSTWSKSEMERYPELEGLFDDMNTFNLSSLLYDWHSKLTTSQNFHKVCESANKTLSNGWNPKQGKHNPTYNKPNDEQINLTNYINWLDRDQTPKPSTEGGFHPNGNSKGGTKVNKAGSSNGKPQTSSSSKSGNGKGETTKNGGL